jgi:hypothetical protein
MQSSDGEVVPNAFLASMLLNLGYERDYQVLDLPGGGFVTRPIMLHMEDPGEVLERRLGIAAVKAAAAGATFELTMADVQPLSEAFIRDDAAVSGAPLVSLSQAVLEEIAAIFRGRPGRKSLADIVWYRVLRASFADAAGAWAQNSQSTASEPRDATGAASGAATPTAVQLRPSAAGGSARGDAGTAVDEAAPGPRQSKRAREHDAGEHTGMAAAEDACVGKRNAADAVTAMVDENTAQHSCKRRRCDGAGDNGIEAEAGPRRSKQVRESTADAAEATSSQAAARTCKRERSCSADAHAVVEALPLSLLCNRHRNC